MTELPLLAPREALQTVIVRCGLPSRVLRWKQDVSAGRERLANLDALLALAVNYEDVCRSRQHAASISGLILWLQEQAADELDPLAEPALDAVKIMTHHGAKGLEWPVVILTDLQRHGQEPPLVDHGIVTIGHRRWQPAQGSIHPLLAVAVWQAGSRFRGRRNRTD